MAPPYGGAISRCRATASDLSLLPLLLLNEATGSAAAPSHFYLEVIIERQCVVALIIRDQNILLGKRAPDRAFYPNVWDLFGGHVERDEARDEALVRELGEELAIRPTVWSDLETIAEPFPEQYGPGRYHLYRVTDWEGTPVNAQPAEHADIRWFSLREALDVELAHPVYRELLARYMGSMTGASNTS